jgi:hypothetical protein
MFRILLNWTLCIVPSKLVPYATELDLVYSAL